MKVKIYPEKGQTREQAEEQLEKALQTKKAALEERYAKESYQNTHLDEFHDYITEEFKSMLDGLTKNIIETVKKAQ